MTNTIRRIENVIAARRGSDPGSSYVASLLAKGDRKIAEKLGEEAIETVIAAIDGDKSELVSESADLLFHLLIMLNEKGLALADVEKELERREGISGHEEKANRSD